MKKQKTKIKKGDLEINNSEEMVERIGIDEVEETIEEKKENGLLLLQLLFYFLLYCFRFLLYFTNILILVII